MLRTRSLSAAVAALLAVAAAPVLAQSGAGATATGDPGGLTDANVAAIVVVANTADIENGELALKLASSDAVKAFARTMVTDHTAVNEQAAKLAAKLGVTPAASQASRDLQAATDAEREKLTSLEGAAFDRAYVANEIAYHASVLKTLDEVLVPETSNAELKALLVTVRPAFVAHLEHAKKLQASLQN
jgi:putative membrane protein